MKLLNLTSYRMPFVFKRGDNVKNILIEPYNVSEDGITQEDLDNSNEYRQFKAVKWVKVYEGEPIKKYIPEYKRLALSGQEAPDSLDTNFENVTAPNTSRSVKPLVQKQANVVTGGKSSLDTEIENPIMAGGLSSIDNIKEDMGSQIVKDPSNPLTGGQQIEMQKMLVEKLKAADKAVTEIGNELKKAAEDKSAKEKETKNYYKIKKEREAKLASASSALKEFVAKKMSDKKLFIAKSTDIAFLNEIASVDDKARGFAEKRLKDLA